MGSIPRSTCFKTIKWILVILIGITVIIGIVSIRKKWDELEKMRKSGDSREILNYAIVWIHLSIWILGFIGIMFEQKGLVMCLASMFVINLVLDIFIIIRDKQAVDIVGMVASVAIIVLSCFYGFRIDAEGGSACQVC